MRSVARAVLIGLVVAGMLNLPVMAAAKPLGMVVRAENAHLGEVKLAMGTNVFPGDFLQTDQDGTLRLRIGATQIYLGAGSGTILEQENGKIGTKLVRGTVGFSSAQVNEFEVDTPIANVRPAKGPAFGEVTLAGPHTILVAAYRGSLIVSGNGTERVIPEGSAFNVTFVADAASSPAQGAEGAGTGNDGSTGNPQQQRTKKAISNPGQIIFTTLVLAAAGGGAYAAWHIASESDPNPNPQ